MNLKHLLILVLLIMSVSTFGQTIKFAKNIDSFMVTKNKPAVYSAIIQCDGVTQDTAIDYAILPSSTFSEKQYDFQASSSKKISVSANKKFAKLFIEITVSSEADYGKFISFQIGSGANVSYSSVIITKPVLQMADSTRYRFMIGTNFDFVDGVKAKDLYYHLQFFVPNAFPKGRFGFIGGIQQNRQISQLDTLNIKLHKNTGYFPDSFRLGRSIRVNNDSFRIVKLDSVRYSTITTTNILQLYLEPTFRLVCSPSLKSETNIYAIFHTDIQFRRINTEGTYAYNIFDTIVVSRASNSKYAEVNAKEYSTEIKYQFNYGLGFLMHHQNQYIDLYTKLMFGKSHLSKTEWNTYYGCEVGIRVVSINLMLGAEYRGMFNVHNPDYMNVYLSKAFSLNKLVDFLVN